MTSSYNTALTHRGQAPRSADVSRSEVEAADNPARLSLRPVSHSLHLSLSGSLMLERYRKLLKLRQEEAHPLRGREIKGAEERKIVGSG